MSDLAPEHMEEFPGAKEPINVTDFNTELDASANQIDGTVFPATLVMTDEERVKVLMASIREVLGRNREREQSRVETVTINEPSANSFLRQIKIEVDEKADAAEKEKLRKLALANEKKLAEQRDNEEKLERSRQLLEIIPKLAAAATTKSVRFGEVFVPKMTEQGWPGPLVSKPVWLLGRVYSRNTRTIKEPTHHSGFGAYGVKVREPYSSGGVFEYSAGTYVLDESGVLHYLSIRGRRNCEGDRLDGPPALSGTLHPQTEPDDIKSHILWLEPDVKKFIFDNKLAELLLSPEGK